MKKSIKILALCLVMVMAVAMLASCGGPSGKYARTDKVLFADVETYWDFDGDEVTFSLTKGVEFTGTYEIKDDKIHVTYSAGSVSTTVDYDYKLDGDTLTINNIEYTKVK